MVIDKLVHSVHEAMVHATAATPGSVNLIEGKADEILELLDDLAYGDTIGSSRASRAMREDFKKKMEEGEAAREEHQRGVEARKAKRLAGKAAERASKSVARRRK